MFAGSFNDPKSAVLHASPPQDLSRHPRTAKKGSGTVSPEPLVCSCAIVIYYTHERPGVLRGTRSLSSYLYVFASSQGATCQPRRATILRSQGSASSIVKMRLMGLTELEYMFQAGCLALNCLLDCDDARMTYSCALNLRFGLSDETLVYFPRRNS